LQSLSIFFVLICYDYICFYSTCNSFLDSYFSNVLRNVSPASSLDFSIITNGDGLFVPLVPALEAMDTRPDVVYELLFPQFH
jgi:hypothetical protein